jgi:hypothetical protein
MVEWLAGNRIRGTSAEKPVASLQSPSVGGWVELARTTLGSTTDTITVSSLADKRYLMFLFNDLTNDTRTSAALRFNSDTGTNYSTRRSRDGGSDVTSINSTAIGVRDNSHGYDDGFSVGYISNFASKEKLLISHFGGEASYPSGTSIAPRRQETVGKWTNTSSAISALTMNNGESGSYYSGTEIVVLGWDPADTHTTNFWEELASVELGGASSTLDSGTFTAKKYLWVQAYINATTVDTGLTFNGDTGANYARRWSDDGGTDGTATGGNNIQVDRGNSTQFLNIFIINNSANEKLGMYHTGTQNTAGAGNAPQRRELIFKWVNTSSQITSMIFTKKGSGTDLQAGSIIKVWGSD